MRSLVLSLIILSAGFSSGAFAKGGGGYPGNTERETTGAGIPGPDLNSTPPPYYAGPSEERYYNEDDADAGYPGELERELTGAGIPGPNLYTECYSQDRNGNIFPGKSPRRAVRACRVCSKAKGCELLGCH